MGAVAVAGAGFIHDALPAHEVSGGQAEDGLGAESGGVEEGGLLDDVRVRALGDRIDKPDGPMFAGGEGGSLFFQHLPCILVEGGIMIADEGAAVAKVPGIVPVGAIGEMPGEDESVGGAAFGGDRLLHVEGGHGVVVDKAVFVGEASIGAEVVPEVEEGIFPVVVSGAPAVGDRIGFGGDEGEGSPGGVVGLYAVTGHVDALEAFTGAEGVAVVACALVDDVALPVARLATAVDADEVAEGAADGDVDGLVKVVGDAVGEDGDRQAAGGDIAGDEGVESLNLDADGEDIVFQMDASEGVGGVEGGG